MVGGQQSAGKAEPGLANRCGGSSECPVHVPACVWAALAREELEAGDGRGGVVARCRAQDFPKGEIHRRGSPGLCLAV